MDVLKPDPAKIVAALDERDHAVDNLRNAVAMERKDPGVCRSAADRYVLAEANVQHLTRPAVESAVHDRRREAIELHDAEEDRLEAQGAKGPQGEGPGPTGLPGGATITKAPVESGAKLTPDQVAEKLAPTDLGLSDGTTP